MFESLATAVPAARTRDVLLRPAAAPGTGDPGSAAERRVLVAVRGGQWLPGVVTAWWWPAAGRPVQWRCLLDLGPGRAASWYLYDPRWLRALDG